LDLFFFFHNYLLERNNPGPPVSHGLIQLQPLKLRQLPCAECGKIGLFHPFARVDYESFQAPVTGLQTGYCGEKPADGKNLAMPEK
jgi:hypothetical protein